MTVRFNPPPAWRQFLPVDFTPAIDWIPEVSWGAPPAGWPMWIETETQLPAAPPQEYRNNPYLYLAVMPGVAETATPTAAMPVGASANNSSSVAPGKSRKPMKKGLKIGLWSAGVLVFIVALASMGGGDQEPASTATNQSTATSTPSPSAEASIDPVAEKSAEAKASASSEAAASSAAAVSASAKEEAEEQAKKDAEASAKAEADAKEAAEVSAKAEAEASAKAEAEAGTLSQQNALEKAGDYLEYSAFSKSGLIDQLEFEGYSAKDAQWAVDRVTVDWNEQAALKAQDYLDYSAFSRSGLIDQLEYEGFTAKQAKYGVSQTGL